MIFASIDAGFGLAFDAEGNPAPVGVLACAVVT